MGGDYTGEIGEGKGVSWGRGPQGTRPPQPGATSYGQGRGKGAAVQRGQIGKRRGGPAQPDLCPAEAPDGGKRLRAGLLEFVALRLLESWAV